MSGKDGMRQSKYLFMIFFLAVLVMAVLIVRPFLSTLIISAVIAYVLYPVYRFFTRLTSMPRFSAAILIVMVLLVSLIPVVVVAGEVTKESYNVYLRVRESLLDSGAFGSCSGGASFLCGLYDFAASVSERFGLGLSTHVARGLSDLTSLLVSKASDFLMDIPKMLIHVFISLFAMYYMLVQGEVMLKAIKKALPLKESDSDRIVGNFNSLIHATVYGAIVLAVFQGISAGIGYLIFGAESPILLGLLTLVAAFIPFLGASLVWFPVALSMLLSGFIADDPSMMLRAGGLAIYGVLAVSSIDNLLRPKIVGDRAKVHPMVMMLGVFGGIAFFGFSGIIIGPLFLTLFIASLKIYQQESHRMI